MERKVTRMEPASDVPHPEKDMKRAMERNHLGFQVRRYYSATSLLFLETCNFYTSARQKCRLIELNPSERNQEPEKQWIKTISKHKCYADNVHTPQWLYSSKAL